jgi:hypothetical protein
MRYGGPSTIQGSLEILGVSITISAKVRILVDTTGSVPPHRQGRLWASAVPADLLVEMQKAVSDPTRPGIVIVLPGESPDQISVTSCYTQGDQLHADFVYSHEHVFLV